MKKTDKKTIGINMLLYGVFAIYTLLLITILFRTQHPIRSINLIPFRGVVSYLSGEDLVSENFYSYYPMAKASEKCGFDISYMDFEKIPDAHPIEVIED